MSDKKEPIIIIVSAPSGSGKTTIVSEVLKKVKGIRRSVSCTTRKPRQDEEDKKDYMFVTKEEFQGKIANDEFLEWENNFGNYYGTLKEEFSKAEKNGEDIILSIDVKGAKRVRDAFPESVGIFIMPPSAEELESRLKGRKTDKEEEVIARLEESKREIAASNKYDYLIINKKVEDAIEEMVEIIETERMRRKNTRKGG